MPKPRRWMSRTLTLMPSSGELDSPSRMAAMMALKCLPMRFTRLVNLAFQELGEVATWRSEWVTRISDGA